MQGLALVIDRNSAPQPVVDPRWARANRKLRGITGVLAVDVAPDLITGSMADRYARQVKRDPADTRVHLARIQALVETADAAELYGAVVDFLIATGSHAMDLRAEVVRGTSHIIGPQRTTALAQSLANGLRARDPIPPAPCSVLTEGITGQPVVRRVVSNGGESAFGTTPHWT